VNPSLLQFNNPSPISGACAVTEINPMPAEASVAVIK
jgi:hypothetical protein